VVFTSKGDVLVVDREGTLHLQKRSGMEPWRHMGLGNYGSSRVAIW